MVARPIDITSLRSVLVTDCGSTTTKALLFERTAAGWRQTCRGEAPTTVEDPVADVTVGARNAFREVEELSGRHFLSDTIEGSPFIFTAANPGAGIDLYLSTSSAGGGLQMLVAGVVRSMTTESAERAALGAGAIVMEAISADDTRPEHERIERIRHVRPDIVLLTGGVDGGSKTHVIEIAETLLVAAPRPRFGETLRLPVIYAGNAAAAEDVAQILQPIATVHVVPNVRPALDMENLGPAREAIHEFFLTHVMSHSPGYGTLLSWSPVPVMPTPAAVGVMVERFARETGLNVLCADIGGATTDVFSVFRDRSGTPVFNRTVSANLGMSYSVANVLVSAGAENILRWVSDDIDLHELRDRLRNKMIRPTSIPQTYPDLRLEQAVCREALRLSLDHHRALAIGLQDSSARRGIADIFGQRSHRYELVDMMKLDVVIGSGGVLSHAPNRMEAALMMLDGFGLAGVTQITVDSIFMLPHLGVLSTVHPDAAQEIFTHDCLVNVAHAIVPVFPAGLRCGEELAEVEFGGQHVGTVFRGKVTAFPLSAGSSGLLRVTPVNPRIDIGAGPGLVLERTITLGCCGLILDGRNRPIEMAKARIAERSEQQAIETALGLYQHREGGAA